jgi:hypothetical protein
MLTLSILAEAAWFIAKYFVLLPFGFCVGVLLLGALFTAPGRPWWDERLVWWNGVRIEPVSVWIWGGLLLLTFCVWLNQ